MMILLLWFCYSFSNMLPPVRFGKKINQWGTNFGKLIFWDIAWFWDNFVWGNKHVLRGKLKITKSLYLYETEIWNSVFPVITKHFCNISNYLKSDYYLIVKYLSSTPHKNHAKRDSWLESLHIFIFYIVSL